MVTKGYLWPESRSIKSSNKHHTGCAHHDTAPEHLPLGWRLCRNNGRTAERMEESG